MAHVLRVIDFSFELYPDSESTIRRRLLPPLTMTLCFALGEFEISDSNICARTSNEMEDDSSRSSSSN